MLETSSATSATLASTSTSRTFRRCSSPRSEAIRPEGGSVFAECIAHAPHRPDVARLGGIGLDLVANVADMNVDGPLVGLQRLIVADQLQQLGAGVDATRATGHMAQQVELGRGQRDALPVTGHASSLQVD